MLFCNYSEYLTYNFLDNFSVVLSEFKTVPATTLGYLWNNRESENGWC